MVRGWVVMALVILGSRLTSPIKRPLRNSRAWGWDAPPIPLLRPFDSAQGERNVPPPGMKRPYFVSRVRGRNDGYAKVTPRQICDSLGKRGQGIRKAVLRESARELEWRADVGGQGRHEEPVS